MKGSWRTGRLMGRLIEMEARYQMHLAEYGPRSRHGWLLAYLEDRQRVCDILLNRIWSNHELVQIAAARTRRANGKAE
jgi:hypothetical protein